MGIFVQIVNKDNPQEIINFDDEDIEAVEYRAVDARLPFVVGALFICFKPVPWARHEVLGLQYRLQRMMNLLVVHAPDGLAVGQPRHLYEAFLQGTHERCLVFQLSRARQESLFTENDLQSLTLAAPC